MQLVLRRERREQAAELDAGALTRDPSPASPSSPAEAA
jgi:hypothetical protein